MTGPGHDDEERWPGSASYDSAAYLVITKSAPLIAEVQRRITAEWNAEKTAFSSRLIDNRCEVCGLYDQEFKREIRPTEGAV
jgi:hypothetical protein